MAGIAPERQERGVIQAVKTAVRRNKGHAVSVQAGKHVIIGVVDAKKYDGRTQSGSEPYTDVVFILYDKSCLNLSLKGESAPSLAGGGLKGLEAIIPGIGKRFFNAVHNHLMRVIRPGDKVPDSFGRLNDRDKLKIVVGNKAIGGPIDYMYIGPMTVSSRYDPRKNLLILNGILTPAKEYARTHNLFFRLRARRIDQRFDPKAKDNMGIPKIYSVSPSRGDSQGRLVIVDRPASGAKVITF